MQVGCQFLRKSFPSISWLTFQEENGLRGAMPTSRDKHVPRCSVAPRRVTGSLFQGSVQYFITEKTCLIRQDLQMQATERSGEC